MQTTYDYDPAIGRAGMIANTAMMRNVLSRIANGPIKAGFGVFRVPGYGTPGTNRQDPGQVYQNPYPAIAVDVDALLTTTAAAVTELVIEAADLDGVAAEMPFMPARRVTMITNSHANWNATEAVIRYYDQDGVLQSETFTIADAGNETLTTTGYVREFVDLTVDAQGGTAATFTLGVTVLDTVTLADFVGVALYLAAREPSQDADAVAIDAEFGDTDSVSVLDRGDIYVTTEDTCTEGGAVYVRIAASGSNTQLGSFRSDADSANAVVVTGAKWGRDSVAGGVNVLRLA